ncbi:MAG: hypothetical protein GVY17_12575 [Cyanobacteria bacterium]|jgi:predicted nucleic acid-binding protein|nr:hypothetical protein [Cyanobacteria bacterium GSL.Bin21]
MPKAQVIVINTSPLISLVAALGDLDFLDETVGRRIARLNGLSVTSSIGILLKYKQQKPSLSIQKAIQNMINHNIYLSQNVINFALKQAGE